MFGGSFDFNLAINDIALKMFAGCFVMKYSLLMLVFSCQVAYCLVNTYLIHAYDVLYKFLHYFRSF